MSSSLTAKDSVGSFSKVLCAQTGFQVADDVTFGPFVLHVRQRELRRNGELVGLGSRALDILTTLVARAGEIVSVRDLVSSVWPGLVIAESNLRVHIAALRRQLGEGHGGPRYIINVPSRGYCFAGVVASPARPEARDSDHRLPTGDHGARVISLPRPLHRMLGRDATVDEVLNRLRHTRFVTVAGPAGMGKTSVAVSVGHRFSESFAGDVRFVDLGLARGRHAAVEQIMLALNIKSNDGQTSDAIVDHLRARSTLLILDNCEHMMARIAPLAELIFAETGAFVLATSQEPLRVEGETVYRLAPLASPPEDAPVDVDTALSYPAIRLFVERLQAVRHDFDFAELQVPAVLRICQKLDGVPLAIELVAGMSGAFGLASMEKLLEARFRLVWHGRRTAAPRHQTLSGMLDWSYQLLSAREQRVLRAVSVFAGSFTVEEAAFVIADPALDVDPVAEAIANLVAKSMAWAEIGGDCMRYRLLDMSRTYARGKHVDSGESQRIRQRHAALREERIESPPPGAEVPPGAS